MKIAVGVPWSSPFMFTGFFDGNMNLRCPAGCDMRWFRGEGWCPARRHIDLCEKALAWGVDLICILGADQQHPEDTIEKLYGHFVREPNVYAAMVPTRGSLGHSDMAPHQPMAWRFKRTSNPTIRRYDGLEKSGDMLEVVNPNDGELQEVDFIGSGVLMFHRDHLLSLSRPWFKERILDEQSQERLAVMDSTFVWRLKREAGARVFVDTTIRPRHLHVFEIDETWHKGERRESGRLSSNGPLAEERREAASAA